VEATHLRNTVHAERGRLSEPVTDGRDVDPLIDISLLIEYNQLRELQESRN